MDTTFDFSHIERNIEEAQERIRESEEISRYHLQQMIDRQRHEQMLYLQNELLRIERNRNLWNR